MFLVPNIFLSILLLYLTSTTIKTLFICRRHAYLAGSMLPVLQIAAYYFALPLPVVILSGEGFGHAYGITFSSAHIFFVMLLMFVVALCYMLGFRIGFGPSKREEHWSRSVREHQTRALWFFFVVLVGADLFYRIDAIFAGTYFSWMRKFNIDEGSQSIFHIIIASFTPLLAALAVHYSGKNRLILFYLAFLISIALLEGKRTTLVLMFFSISSVFVLHKGYPGGIRRKFFRLVLGASLVLFLMSVILDVRRDFRSDVSYALENPVAFLLQSTSDNLLSRVGLGEEKEYEAELSGSSLSERSALHLITFATLAKQYVNGHDLLPFANFVSDTMRAVPSVIIGKKEGYSAGNAMALHFQFRDTASGHHDPGSTVYQAIFAIFGPLGSVLLAVSSGMAFGFLFRILVKHFGSEAWVMSYGLVSLLMINGNNYSAVLTNMRHFVMLLFVLSILSLISKLFARRSSANLTPAPLRS